MERLLIHAGTVVTGARAHQVLHNQGVLLENGRIVAVDDRGQFGASPEAELVDATGLTVLPGLIDAHTHVVHDGDPDESWQLVTLTRMAASGALRAARNARRQVEMGITTIRDLGAHDWIDVCLRDAIAEGWQSGPRMVVAGHGITAPGGHMDARRHARPGISNDALASIGVVAASADEARERAWEQLMRGADVLKVNATLSEYVRASGGRCSPELPFDALRAVCEVAHTTGRRVAAHCHGGAGVQAALDAGVDTFEHGRFLSDEQLDQMAESQRFLVPTLSPEAQSVAHNAPPADAATRRWYTLATGAMYDTVERAHRRGVAIVAGTDAGMPRVYHGSLSFELRQLARAGLSNYEAIAAGTRVAAEALGLADEVGQVAPGLVADLLLVNGDPVRDLAVLSDANAIRAVLQAGRLTAGCNAPERLRRTQRKEASGVN